MKSKLIKYFIVIAGLLSQSVCAQMEKEKSFKAYEQVHAFQGSDSAVYLVFEYQADTNSQKLERPYAGSYAKISSQKRNEKKYMYSLYTFVNDQGNFCSAFPSDLSTFFNDTVIVEFLLQERDQFVSFYGSNDVLPKQFEFQFHNVAKLGLESGQFKRTDSNWLIKNSDIFALYSQGIYSPYYLIQHQASIGGYGGFNNAGFLVLVLTNVFEREELAFEPRRPSSSLPVTFDLFLSFPYAAGQLTLLIGKGHVNSAFFKKMENSSIHFLFPIDAFINFSGKARVQYNGNTILESYRIPKELTELETVKKMFTQLPEYTENTSFVTKKELEYFLKTK